MNKRIEIKLCDGCGPITLTEFYALYCLTGEHIAADEVVRSVRKKLSHTLLDVENLRELVGADYYDEWTVEKTHRDFANFTPTGETNASN